MKPYGTGYNGHANKCDCSKCGKVRRAAFSRKLTQISKLAEWGVARTPTSSDQTVFVRAHFKRAPNHLRRFPRTLQLIRRTLKGAL